jgi:membrane fusion protein, multidrug efflux system
LFRRHFFLIGALVALAVMVVVGGLKFMETRVKSEGGGASAGGPGGPGGPGGRPGGPGGGRGGPGGPGGGTQVSVVTVQTRTFIDTIEVLGVAKGRQSVTLTAAATQLVERVRFSDGQSVARGAVLVELKDTEQDAGLDQAKARLVQAEAAYNRYLQLGERGFASKAAIDQYRAAFRSAEADVAAAQARRNDRLIRAPFAGVVGLSDVAPGALVNPGAPIVTLDDVSSMRVDFQVPERYLDQIREGQAILATVDAYPGQTINGRIARLDSRVDERTRAITARAIFPNPKRLLKPGMLVRVGISRGTRQSPSAPESALSVQGNSAFVFALRKMGERTVAEQRPVVTGVRQQGFVEILDGVRPGDQIIADGLNKVQPGQPVRIAGSRPPGGGPGRQRPPT